MRKVFRFSEAISYATAVVVVVDEGTARKERLRKERYDKDEGRGKRGEEKKKDLYNNTLG
jgi:hypothetical protein